jgi:hypothetical protein
MDFGDAGDHYRGFAVLDTVKDDLSFHDWKDCPKYFKVTLSNLVESGWCPPAKSRIQCIKDLDLSYTEAQTIREEFIKSFGLREFKIEEIQNEKEDSLNGEGDSGSVEIDSMNLGDTIVQLISLGVQKTTSIDPERLCEEYKLL